MSNQLLAGLMQCPNCDIELNGSAERGHSSHRLRDIQPARVSRSAGSGRLNRHRSHDPSVAPDRARSPETPLPWTRDSRPRALGAAVLARAILLTGLLAAGAAGAATLTSNTGQSAASATSDISSTNWSQGFTTGNNATGYILDSIKIKFDTVPGNSDSVTVKIRDGFTGTVNDVVTLTSPGTWTETSTFTAPANTKLRAVETYYLFISGDGGQLSRTDADGEDSGGAAGWSIANVHVQHGSPGATISSALQIAVEGTPVPPDIVTPTANDDGSDTLWTATLYAEEFLSGGLTYIGFSRLGFKGTMTSNSFSIGETSYPIHELLDASTTPPRLEFAQFAPGWPQESSNWVLHVDETAFRASDADKHTLTRFEWDNPGLNWADDDEVAIKLVRLNAPPAPSNLTASAASSGRIELSWSAPSKSGGEDITGYRIEVSTDGGDNWNDLVADTASTDTMYSHKGLSASSTRHYRVSAINAIGTGAVSNEASATTASDITTTTANADGSDTLWSATLTVGTDNLGTFGYHRVNAFGSLSSDTFDFDGSTRTISSMHRGTVSFTLAISPKLNDIGNATLHLGSEEYDFADATPSGVDLLTWTTLPSWNDGDEVAVRLVRQKVPTAARNLNAKAVSATRIDLSWTAPSSTGGKDITGYKIEVSTDDGDNYTNLVADTGSPDTAYSHKGAAPGTTYQYRVSAINATGTGPVSNEASATTEESTDITTTTANRDGSDTLWSATLTVGTDNLGTFGYHRVHGFGSLSSDTFNFDESTRTISLMHRGAVNFTLAISPKLNDIGNATLHLGSEEYDFADATASGVDLLNWTTLPSWNDGDEVAVRLVRRKVPTAPRNLHAKGESATQINLSWRAPEKSGGADITGYKIEVSTDGGSNWSDLVADTESTDTTYEHTSLTSGDTRHYRVSAINAVGTGPASSESSGTAEATAPGVASAVVERINSLVVVLEFDELVDTTSTPDKSAFAVKANRQSLTVTSFEITDSGQFGRVGLASRVGVGETVTLSYTKPGTNPLKAKTGTDQIATFSNFPVTNEVSTDFPVLSMQGAEVHESGDPNNPETIMTFTVSVDTEPDFPVGVHYETEDVTATGGASCTATPIPDYISTEGRLFLGPGESSKEVDVTICDDSVSDSGETFRLVLNSTQLHEPISALGEIGPEGKSYEGEETGSQTGTILNDETTTVLSIVADAAYTGEGTEAVFTLRRAGDAEAALTVPVTVAETGAMLGAEVPENAAFAAGERETELRVPTEDDGADETDSTVTATLETGADWLVAEDAASATLTVLDNDAAPVTSVSASDVTVWSADMTVVDYENGNIGAGSADLLANQGGTAGLQAKWLYYVTGERKLKIAFDDGLDDAESMSLHVGGLSVAFPENSGGDSSFTIEDVDASWTDGESLAARVSKPSAEAVSTEATLKSLAISDAAVSPAFDSGTLLYTAVVDSATASVTVSAESNDDDAEVAVVPFEDADSEQAGHQVAVPVGETLVTVTVTAADGQTQRAYRVHVKRPPTVAVSFASGSYAATEGGAEASVSIELSANPRRDVTIPLTASPAGGATAEDYTVPASATFTNGGALSQTVVVTAVADDTAEEGESVVLGFGNLPDGVEAGATASAAVNLADAAAEVANTEPTGLPTIGGTPQVGKSLTASVTDIEDTDGTDNATFAYQWVSNDGTSDSDIGDATKSSYELVDADAGKTIKVRVTFTDDGGTEETLTSESTTAVAAAPQNTAPEGLPTIAGTPQVGEELTASVTGITDADGTGNATFAYQWVSNDGTSDADIEDATKSSYELAASDAGKTIKVRVTFTDDGGTEETLTSVATDAVAAAPQNTAPEGLPTIAGTPQVGEELTASVTGITDADGTGNATFAYQWVSNDGTSDADVEDATESSYELAASDAGKTIKVRVTFTDDGGTEETLTSVATDAVAAAPQNTAPEGLPTIAGTPQVGEELTASVTGITDADGTGNATFAYQWVSNNGTSDADVEDATESSYELAASDAGKTIKVRVTFTDDGGTEETLTSVATDAVAAAAEADESELSVTDAQASEEEDSALEFVVTLDVAATATVTVDYATSDGTATAGEDYTGTSGTLTFQAGDTTKTVSVPITDDTEDDGGETLTLTLSNATGAELGDAVATGTITNTEAPVTVALTASLENVPAEHDGSTEFTFRVRFSEDPKVSYTVLRDEAFAVTGGVVRKARRVDGRNDLREIHIKPTGYREIAISLAPTTDCNAADAICTADERPLSHSLSATVAGPAGISVADARAQEGTGNTVDFTVTLSRESSGTVTVGYATSDGTATAGQDYTAASGTLTFAPGETSGSVSVAVLDDTHDDDGETFTLRLSSASGGRLTDDTATGTIENADPMPQAWLARFGRAASDHVVEAISDRWRDGDAQMSETHFTLGGRQVNGLFSAWDGIGTRFAPTGAGTGHPGLAEESTWARMDRLASEALAGPAGGNPAASSLTGGGLSAMSVSGAIPPASGGLAGDGLAGRGRAGGATSGGEVARFSLINSLGLPTGDLRDVLMGSSFFYSKPLDENGEPEGSSWLGQLSAWGETAATRFSGADGPLSLNGEVATGILGVDSRWDRWLAGVTLSHSEGEGAYTHPGAAGGGVTSTLTSLNPYVHYRLNERTSLWGVVGYGVGGLKLTPEGAESVIETDLATTMAAFGGRGVLSVRSGRAGAFELAILSDALVTNTVSDSVENLIGAAGATSRLRVMLEGSGSMPLGNGGMLKPTLEAGLRYDDGDAETGAGFEIGGGLGYAIGQFAVEVNGRMLLAHEDTEYEEWGFSGAITYQPNSDGRGISMNLGSAWGTTQSGVQSLWSRQDAGGLARGAAMHDAAQRFKAEVGYGFSGRRNADARWAPFLGVESGDGGGQAIRTGVRLTSGPNLDAGLEFGRRGNGREAPEDAVQLKGMVRF